MRFIVNSTKLLKALDNVQGVVDKKNITPILSNVRLSAKDNQLIINATDMDLDIVEFIESEVLEEGSTTASAYMMFETVKKLPNGSNMEFSLVDEQLMMKCGKFKANLQCLPVEDFPIIQTDNLPNSFKVLTSDLKKILEKTRFAISMDETRYYLNGIFLQEALNTEGKKVLRAVSTDGHRLALVDAELQGDLGAEDLLNGIIIPKKAVEEIVRLLDRLQDKEVNISVSPTRISMKFASVVLTSKLIDGNFPNYNRVIPTDNDKSLEVNRADFINAVNLVSTYSDDKLKAIKIEIEGNKIRITAARSDALAEQELDIVNALEPMVICFNAKYLNDISALIKSENLVIKLNNSASPALIKQADINSEVFVIMPMRI
jgi:DNA polymerase-3 subunit beta